MGPFKAEEDEEDMIFSSSTFFSPECATVTNVFLNMKTLQP